jgi:hypothetical protein
MAALYPRTKVARGDVLVGPMCLIRRTLGLPWFSEESVTS